MNTEDDFDEFVTAMNAAMTTPAYPATPDEIEALAAEEFHLRVGARWEGATDSERGEFLQWASLTLISPAMQNVLRSAQALALDQAGEDIYAEIDGFDTVEEWLDQRAQQIRNGKR